MKLVWRKAATRDLNDIWNFSEANWGRSRADRYMTALRDTAVALAEGKLSGVAANDIQPSLRRQVSGSHVIWFRVEADLLRVVRVLHQSRDAGKWV